VLERDIKTPWSRESCSGCAMREVSRAFGLRARAHRCCCCRFIHSSNPPLFPQAWLDLEARTDLLTKLGFRSKHNRSLYNGLMIGVAALLVLGIYASGRPPTDDSFILAPDSARKAAVNAGGGGGGGGPPPAAAAPAATGGGGVDVSGTQEASTTASTPSPAPAAAAPAAAATTAPVTAAAPSADKAAAGAAPTPSPAAPSSASTNSTQPAGGRRLADFPRQRHRAVV